MNVYMVNDAEYIWLVKAESRTDALEKYHTHCKRQHEKAEDRREGRRRIYEGPSPYVGVPHKEYIRRQYNRSLVDIDDVSEIFAKDVEIICETPQYGY